MKNRLLFVTERWCDGTPNLGLTNNFHNLFNTFSQAQGDRYNWNTIHLDEAAVVYGTHIDEILPKYCLQWDIKVIVFSLLGQSPVNPSKACYEKLKSLGVYLCFMWPDTGIGWPTQTINQLENLADLNIIWDNPTSSAHNALTKSNKWLELWVPQDQTMFYTDKQTIPVSFIGSDRYADRTQYLNFFKSKLPEYTQFIRGGQREEKLSPESYARLIRQSSIGINFAASPAGFWQTKGRIFEILASSSLLLESKNPATEKLFTPGEDYVEFTTPEDLVEKTKYYIENQTERRMIAESGHKKYMEKYTAYHFWEAIMDRIERETNGK